MCMANVRIYINPNNCRCSMCCAAAHLANQTVASLGEGHHGGGGAATLSVGDDGGLATLHGRDGAVGGAQVDTHHLSEGGAGATG